MSLSAIKTPRALFSQVLLLDSIETLMVAPTLRAFRTHNPPRELPVLPTFDAIEGVISSLEQLEVLAVSGPMEVRFHAHLMFK
jgi:hypothetical protein